jgi:hypothetical protein
MLLFAFDLLGLQFHRGLKAIHQQPRSLVQFTQLRMRQHAHEPSMAHDFAHHRAIFRLDVSVLIGTVRTAARQRDLFLLARGK